MGPSRRSFLQSAACGFGLTALRGLWADEPLAPRAPAARPPPPRVIVQVKHGGP
jgi:hypothetical protein